MTKLPLLRYYGDIPGYPFVGCDPYGKEDMTAPLTRLTKNVWYVFTYKNYKGEVRERCVEFHYMSFGTTSYYPEPGWILTGYDTEKASIRQFSLGNIEAGTFRILPLGSVWEPPKDPT